jgi:hypothetical protein
VDQRQAQRQATAVLVLALGLHGHQQHRQDHRGHTAAVVVVVPKQGHQAQLDRVVVVSVAIKAAQWQAAMVSQHPAAAVVATAVRRTAAMVEAVS